ncbi:MAG TPA: YbfB/YjiJ family MFS transporter [Mycobacterium sp.]|nr:YbfB/YjiJ family MFS transporter [Mycobacterium sp.]
MCSARWAARQRTSPTTPAKPRRAECGCKPTPPSCEHSRRGGGTWLVVGVAAAPSAALWAFLSARWSHPKLLVVALFVQAIGIALPLWPEARRILDRAHRGCTGRRVFGAGRRTASDPPA